MSLICYAVEIDTGTDYTDADIGIVDGVMRYVTGRPSYDGTITPTWGANERESGDITDTWYEGFLTTVGQTSASVDLSYIGDYGSLSGFDFSLSCAVDIADELESNDVYLTNKKVRLYVVLDDVFRERWAGVIKTVQRDESTLKISCADDFTAIHKPIPQVLVNREQFPLCEDQSCGEPIPVCIGDVTWAKLQSIGADPDWQVLAALEKTDLASDYKIFAAPILHSAFDSDGFVNLWIKTNLSFAAGFFTGKYLAVVAGTDSDQTRGFRVSHSTETTIGTGGGAFSSQQFFRVILDAPPIKNPTEINADHLYSDTTTADIWFVAIAQLTTENAVSQREIVGIGKKTSGIPKIYKYDSTTKRYADVSVSAIDVHNAGENGYIYPGVTFLSKSTKISGEISAPSLIPISEYELTTTYRVPWFSYGLIGWRTIDLVHPWQPLQQPTSDSEIDREQVLFYVQENIPTGSYFDVFSVAARIPQIEAKGVFDKLYFCIDGDYNCYNEAFNLDFEFTVEDAFGKEIRASSSNTYYKRNSRDIDLNGSTFPSNISSGATSFDVTSPGNFTAGKWALMVELSATPSAFDHSEWVLITDIDGSTITISAPLENSYTSADGGLSNVETVNYIPTELYRIGKYPVYDTSTVFGVSENLGGADISFMDAVEIPSDIIEAIKNSWVSNKIKITVRANPADEAIFSARIKNIAFVAVNSVDTIGGNVYCRAFGEVASGNPTNTIKNALQHIMENYDGIPAAAIDYGNIDAVRSDWAIGKQLLDVKSSYDYLLELCKNGMFAIAPSRTGKRKISAWLDDSGSPVAIDQTDLVRGSIEMYEKTPAENAYNEIVIKYGYSDGDSKCLQTIGIRNVDKEYFPPKISFNVSSNPAAGQPDVVVDDGSIFHVGDILLLYQNDLTTDGWVIVKSERCVVQSIATNTLTMEENIKNSYTGVCTITGKIDEYCPGISYNDGKYLWEYCHTAYLRSGSVFKMPDSDAEKQWIPDYDAFGVYANVGGNSAAYFLLRNYCAWITRQKYRTRFQLPVTATNLELDLTDKITFSDTVFTGGTARDGWIEGVSLDPDLHRLTVDAILVPDGYDEDIDNIIIETGSNTDLIEESGSQSDTIAEGGQ